MLLVEDFPSGLYFFSFHLHFIFGIIPECLHLVFYSVPLLLPGSFQNTPFFFHRLHFVFDLVFEGPACVLFTIEDDMEAFLHFVFKLVRQISCLVVEFFSLSFEIFDLLFQRVDLLAQHVDLVHERIDLSGFDLKYLGLEVYGLLGRLCVYDSTGSEKYGKKSYRSSFYKHHETPLILKAIY